MAEVKRKKRGGDEGGGANWMDTYGDMVTLLMTFFILLFAMSTVDAEKFQQLAASLSGLGSMSNAGPAIQQPAQPPITIEDVKEDAIERADNLVPLENRDKSEDSRFDYETPSEQLTEGEVIAREMFEQLVINLETALVGNNLYADVLANPSKFEVIIRFRANVFFDSGSADLRPDSMEMLIKMQKILSDNQDLFSVIRIEGHTDDVPINTFQYPSNWELSTSRATSVLRYILEEPPFLIDPPKLNASGYGEYHPVSDNETAEGRAMNRRVDFVIEGFRDANEIEMSDPIPPTQILEENLNQDGEASE